MTTRFPSKMLVYAMSVAALTLLLAACGGGGISEEDAESLREDVDSIEQRLSELDEQIAAIEQEEGDPAETASESRTTLEDLQDQIAQLREDLTPPEPEPAPEGGGGGAGGGEPLAPTSP